MASTLESFYSWTLPSPRVLSSLQEDDDISDASEYSSDDSEDHDSDDSNTESEEDLDDENDEPVQIARKLLFDCWKQDHSPAMGNLYDGGLGTYFVLMEYAQRRTNRKLKLRQRKRQRRKQPTNGMQTPKRHTLGGIGTSSPRGSVTPRSSSNSAPPNKAFFNSPPRKKRTSIYRSKHYLKQACDAAEKACQSYHQTMSTVTTSFMYQKQNNISIFQSEWVGARALYGVCLYHLEQEHVEPDPLSTGQTRLSLSSVKPTTSTPDRTSIASDSIQQDGEEKTSRAKSILDDLVEEMLEKASHERSNTVLSGRAGALQAIFWIRSQLRDPYWSQEAVVELAKQIVQGGILTVNTEATVTTEDTTHTSGPESPSTSSGLPGRQSYRHGNFRPPKLPKSDVTREGAIMGQIGILHTLLNLTAQEWNLIEEQVPGSKQMVHGKLDSLTVPLLPSKHPKDTPEHCTNWAHGATSLAFLWIQASQVFQSKSYLLEALDICDNIIWPKISGDDDDSDSEGVNNSASKTTRPPPMGLAKGTTGMAFLFLALSEYCPKPVSTLWLRRAEFLARMALEHSSLATSLAPTPMDMDHLSTVFPF
ncbi:unnamed protein product, partial [Cylindrotheca closterium]